MNTKSQLEQLKEASSDIESTDPQLGDGFRNAMEIQHLMQKIEDLKSNRKLRQEYATNIFRYLILYSLFVGGLVVSAGLNLRGFTLPESVLGYLVGSTAVSAIGLVLAVTTGLFKP